MKSNTMNSEITEKAPKHILNISIILAISIAITFMFGGFSGNLTQIFLNVAYGFIIGLSIALGCGWISTKMLSKKNWEDNPTPNFVKVVLSVSLFILVDVIIVNMIWFSLTQNRGIFELFQYNFFIIIMAVELIVGMIIYLIILSARFAKKISLYHIKVEEERKEKEQFRFENLKNQINPHFLFNSLNVLSGIIYQDTEKADAFILKLSDIYRYVLKVQDEEVVRCSEEIAFIEDYLSLLNIRFGNALSYEIEGNSDKMILPMSLQILVENAIQHNSISTENPLKISILIHENHVEISNNCNPKMDNQHSHGLGLKNLENRFAFLSKEKIQIQDLEETFTVRIPLLNLID